MMLIAVLLLLIGALMAPWVHRAAHGATGWLLAVLPAGLLVWFWLVVAGHGPLAQQLEVYQWVPSLDVNLAFNLDGLSLTFATLILGIGALILIYAGGYLHDDRRLGRFFAYLLLFMAAMLGMVLSDNVYALFIFWELTGISSYLLIGWEHQRAEARKAALTALLVTGVGGLFMLAGFVLLNITSHNVNLSEMDGELIRQSAMYLPILLLIFAGAATKSAQVPFHFWLPSAMAAPTPVSAYLHSATMVKAGIYLLARLLPTLGNTPQWFWLLTAFGAATMLTGGIGSVLQKDLKRILAYSTICVLGTLTMLIGIGSQQAIIAAMVYLVAHSLYKGALFMGAGTLDHETSTRDITELRGLAKLMPISAAIAVIAAASNAGALPMFGFVAKELMYEATLHGQVVTGGVTSDATANLPAIAQWITLAWPWVLMTSAFVASVMLVVVGFMVGYRPYFGGKPMAPKTPHEAPIALWLGGAILACATLILGFLPGLFGNRLGTAAATAMAGVPLEMKLALWHGPSMTMTLSAITLAVGALIFFACRRWHSSWCDFGLDLETYGPAKIYDHLYDGLMRFAKFQTGIVQNGYLRNYVFVIITTLIVLVALPMWRSWPILKTVDPGELTMPDVVLTGVILGSALAANFIRSRMGIVVILACIGICVMLLYVLFGAMDLALTQIMVETLTVILMVLVIYHLPRMVPASSRLVLVRDAILSILFGAVMTALVLMSATLYPSTDMREFFVANSYKLAHSRNIVNSILVDFRAMDTFGEITVLAVAGIGVFALLSIRVKKEK